MSSEVILKVENVGKRYEIYEAPHHRLLQTLLRGKKQFYKEFWALKDLSFEVKKGECLGIIGRNGCGKSTLLQIIAGTLASTTGSVSVTGKVAALLELGSGFNPEFTGRENVYMNGAIMGLSRTEIEQKFDEIAAFADIGEFIEQPVKIYSSGMMVRLAFAAAINVDPNILIIDEALSVGDVFFQQKCHARIEELISNGTTVIIVSHDMPSIEKYSDNVLLIDQGQMLFWGQPNEAVNRYYALFFDKPLNTVRDLPSSDANCVCENISSESYGVIHDWPSSDAFLDFSRAIFIGNMKMVKCRKIAVCNQAGQSCDSFQIGETVSFFTEFEALENIDVPISGVDIINSLNLVLHSKGTMHHLLKAPPVLKKGQIVRFKQTLKLSLAPGDYSFVVAFATMKAEHYEHACEMSASSLISKINPVFRINQIGIIRIQEKKDGLRLPFHGFIDLEGNAACELIV